MLTVLGITGGLITWVTVGYGLYRFNKWADPVKFNKRYPDDVDPIVDIINSIKGE